MDLSLRDKVALVSGSTKGIGRGVAYTLAQEGAHVFINSRKSSAIEEQVNKWRKENLKTSAAIGDVSDVIDAKRIVSGIVVQTGRIDIVVNNVGHYDYKRIEEISVEEWDETIKANWRSAFLITKEAVPIMKKQRWGRIINISSVRGFSGRSLGSPYNVSKGGLLSFTQGLAKELGPYNITCNSVAPGYILTEGMKELSERMGADCKNLENFSPLGKLGRPEDVGNFVAFLASPLANFITGQTFVIDGGAFI